MGANRVRVDELLLLSPNAATACIEPRSSDAAVVAGAPDDGRVAIGGQRDRGALTGSNRVRVDEHCLLSPNAATACIDPRGSGAAVGSGAPNDGRVAVRG